MATLPPLIVQVTADTKGLQAGMAQAQSTVQKASGTLTAFGVAGGLSMARAGQAVMQFAEDSVHAFLEAEESAFLLNAAVERSEQVAEDATEAFLDQANALQSLTGYSDEAIQSAQAIYLRLGANQDQIERLTELTLDYARATGVDVPAAAQGISKAVQGSTRALKTVGITYTATGDKTKDLTNIMKLLEDQVGGTADAFGDTLPGQIEIAQAKLDEFREDFGESILKPITDPSLETALLGIFSGLGDSLRDEVIPAVDDTGAAFDVATGVLYGYADALDSVTDLGGAFAGMSISEFTKWRKGVQDDISAVEGSFDKLGDKAHLTAAQIISSFRRQAEAVRDYDANLQTLVNRGVGERILQYLIEQGPDGIQIIDTLASHHGATYRKMIAGIRDAIAADRDHAGLLKGIPGLFDGIGGAAQRAKGDVDRLGTSMNNLPTDHYFTIHISSVGGIPAGVGGGIGGPGPGGQTSAAVTPAGGMPSPSKSGVSKTSTIIFQGPVYGMDDFERKVEEAQARSISRWEAV